MFLGNLGLALNILTIAILSLCFTLVLISIIGNRFHGVLLKFNASSRSKLLWCIVTIPWLISLLSVLVLVFPELFNWEKSWVTSNFHWHHIYSFSIISWHGASLLIFTGLCFFILLSKLVKALEPIEMLINSTHFQILWNYKAGVRS